jgi:hypothetical protein
MNPLLQVSRAEILERQMFSKSTFADNQILAALEAYDLGGSEKKLVLDFINALMPLWGLYKKENHISMFVKFIEMEIGLETFSEHASHANHVLQEFLFGYNIILNCSYIKEQYDFESGRQNNESNFGELFFSWMAAALFHDVGYDIEMASEEEAFRDQKNKFWDFMTARALTASPLTFLPGGPGQRIIESYLLNDIQKILSTPQLSFVDFEKLFLRKASNNSSWMIYDHGVISAVKYLSELEKLEQEGSGIYLKWESNRRAAMAMALHNFKFKCCDIHLSCINPDTLIAYLLIVCDEVQEWERERNDADFEIEGQAGSGKKAKRATKLIGVTFREKHAYIILNHKLKDISFNDSFVEYMDEKLALLKQNYPIRILYPLLREKIRMSILKAPESLEGSIKPVIENAPDGYMEITLDSIDKLEINENRAKGLRKIANASTDKMLLMPSKPEPIYEIYVDHRIEGEPYLTVIFPM